MIVPIAGTELTCKAIVVIQRRPLEQQDFSLHQLGEHSHCTFGMVILSSNEPRRLVSSRLNLYALGFGAELELTSFVS